MAELDTSKINEILNYYGLKTNIEETKKWVKQYVGDALTGITTDLMTNVTYDELVSLRDNNNLKPGMLYRMTDYVTKVYSDDGSVSSAEHPFDLILFANTTNSLNENAFAIQHEGDEYFSDSNLNAWEIKYSLDNDDMRFEFVDYENGKGVIYYMKDEYNNEAPFDFKNILQNDGEYTFGNNGEDYSLNGYVNGIYNNKILPCVNSETGKQTINKIRVTGEDYNTNIFKPTCVNSYIDFPISECEISMNDDGELVIFKTQDFVSGIENKPIEHNYKNDYLTFEAVNDDTEIIFKTYTDDTQYTKTIEVSKDKVNWESKTSSENGTILATLNAGEKLYLRGDNSSYTYFDENEGEYLPNFVLPLNDCYVYGNIMSLIDSNNFRALTEITEEYTFYSLFYDYWNNEYSGEYVWSHPDKKLVLPATTLASYCYQYMFYNCSSLTSAPELPATTLAEGCYSHMFYNCTSLTTAPELPATTLANNCYQYMFVGCSSLTTAPELPATTLASHCYGSMFDSCRSLTTAPELPATTLAEGCYNSMFDSCSSLTTAPELPATTLANSCYQNMFSNCTSLTTAPELPATTLAEGCYNSMFDSCSSLTTAPELPATTLAQDCYYRMFYGCSGLNYIKCLAVNGINTNSSTYQWVRNVAPTGTFIKHPEATSWSTGNDGIPTNWTVEDAKPENYITFTALENNVPISLNRISSNQKLLYSTDDGETWNNFTTGITITLSNSGDTCYITGILSAKNTGSKYTQFNLPNRVSVSGSINSLWNYMDLEQNLYQYCGYRLFNGCTGLVNASELTLCTSATTLASYCYYYMFNGCTSLATAPVLPATTLAQYCYQRMFNGCTSLATAPELPATTLAQYCYQRMFAGCTSLTSALELPATTLASHCYGSMFVGCSSLTTAPELPATTLASYCYSSMFERCGNLTTAPVLPATTLAEGCYQYMFNNCTSLVTAPELPATTLAEGCYSNMFYNCTSLTTAPVLPATTLAQYCYQYMFAYCSSLITAPELPATTLADWCYRTMFIGCTNLTTAPVLPATTLADWCYQYMFNGCTSLTSAPELPATTLTQYCYDGMFNGCTSLATAPVLPATTLAEDCYSNMFYNCSSLTTAPELPATTLANGCYMDMFQGCSSLTTAPALPATTLASRCYNYMFAGCSNLNYIKCLAVNGIGSSTSNWVNGVQTNSGTFVKHPAVSESTWGRSVNGIPTNWTVEHVVIE